MDFRQTLRDAGLFRVVQNTESMRNSLDGIDRGIYNIESTIKNSHQVLSSQISNLSDMLGEKLSNISSHLAYQNEILGNLQTTFENPIQNEASELKRMGISAFENGWLEESKSELERSINKYAYDCQSHFYLYKVNLFLNNEKESYIALSKSLKYAQNNPQFLQLIYFDLSMTSMEKGDMDLAQDFFEKGLAIDKESLITNIYILLKKVQENSFEADDLMLLEKIVNLWEGEEPTRIYTFIIVISSFIPKKLESETEKALNKIKFRSFKSNVNIALKRYYNILYLTDKTLSKNSFVSSIVPDNIRTSICPELRNLKSLIVKLKKAIELLKGSTIEDFAIIACMPEILHSFDVALMNSYKRLIHFQDLVSQNNALANPFGKFHEPDVGLDKIIPSKMSKGEYIVIQTRLESNDLITLTTHNLILTRSGRSIIVKLIDIKNISFDELKRDLREINKLFDDTKHTMDAVTFSFVDNINDQVLMVDTSSIYLEDYGKAGHGSFHHANILTVIWSRAQVMGSIINFLDLFSTSLKFINSFTSQVTELICNDIPKESDDDVEFVDDEEVEFVE